HQLGGYRVQGRDPASAQTLLDDAKSLEQAGASLLLLESVPVALAADITRRATVPVIGIGAGPQTDAQILVLYDLLGIIEKHPKFSKNFLAGASGIRQAVQDYIKAVKSGAFPAVEHSFS
ncbi:MAG: 3-methyl-2-oxobutanoate hydroxymethyltransferase, partial [Gammaproteobacteria bacterium]